MVRTDKTAAAMGCLLPKKKAIKYPELWTSVDRLNMALSRRMLLRS
jgi:hypothetical protein